MLHTVVNVDEIEINNKNKTKTKMDKRFKCTSSRSLSIEKLKKNFHFLEKTKLDI